MRMLCVFIQVCMGLALILLTRGGLRWVRKVNVYNNLSKCVVEVPSTVLNSSLNKSGSEYKVQTKNFTSFFQPLAPLPYKEDDFTLLLRFLVI